MTEITLSIDGRQARVGADEFENAVSDIARAGHRAEDAAKGVSNSMQGIGNAAAVARQAIGLLGLGLGVNELVQFTRQSLDAIDAMNDMGERAGVSAEMIQRYNYVLKLNGGAVTDFTAGLRFMNRTLSEAAQGSDEAVSKFSQLGLSVDQLLQLDSEQQFLTIADSISSLGRQSDITAASMDIFGRGAERLIPVIARGADGIRSMTQEAEDLGIVLSQEQVQKIAEFNDELDVLKLRAQAAAAEGFLFLRDNMELFAAVLLPLPYLLYKLNEALASDFTKAVEAAAESEEQLLDLKRKMRGADEDQIADIRLRIDEQKKLLESNIKVAESEVQLLNARILARKDDFTWSGTRDYNINSERQTEAVKQLGEMYRTLNGYNDLLKPASANTERYSASLGKVGQEAEKATSSLTTLNQSLEEQVRVAEIEARYIGASNVDKEIALQLDQARAAALEDYNNGLRRTVDLTPTEIDLIRTRTEALEEANEKVREAEEAADDARQAQEQWARDLYRPFDTAVENVQRAFADMFYEGKFSFESLGDIAKRTAAEVAAAWVIRPVINGVMSIAGLGVDGGGNVISGATGGTNGGGFSLSNLGSIGSSLLNGGLYSSFLGDIGYSLGSMLDPSGLIGPSANGAIGAGAFGNMGYGAIGSIAANLFGLGGGTGGMIGGTLGTLAGGAIGSSLGTILGFAGGPLGAIAGGFLGTALGGLFGGSTPSQYVGTQVDVGADGKFYSKGFGSDEASSEAIEAYKTLQQTTIDGLNAFVSTLGGTVLNAPELQFNSSGKRDGGRIRVGIEGLNTLGGSQGAMNTQAVFTDPEEAVNYAILQVMRRTTIGGLGTDVQRYYQNAFTSNTTAEGALSDLQNLQAVFAELQEASEPLSDVETIIKSINDAFGEYKETAERLKFTVTDLNRIEAKRQEQLAELRDGFNDGVADSIRQIIDPLGVAVEAEIERYQQQLRDAQALGADLDQVEILHQINLQNIYAQQAGSVEQMAEQFSQIVTQLNDARGSLLTGSLSTLSPEQQFAYLQSQYESTSALALQGDEGALSRLQGVTEQFLEAGRTMFGSSEQYAQLFDQALANYDQALQTAQEGSAGMMGQMVEGINGMRDQLADLLMQQAAGGEVNQTLLRQLRDQFTEMTNNLKTVLAG